MKLDLAQASGDDDVTRSKAWHGLSPDAKLIRARSTTSPDLVDRMHYTDLSLEVKGT